MNFLSNINEFAVDKKLLENTLKNIPDDRILYFKNITKHLICDNKFFNHLFSIIEQINEFNTDIPRSFALLSNDLRSLRKDLENSTIIDQNKFIKTTLFHRILNFINTFNQQRHLIVARLTPEQIHYINQIIFFLNLKRIIIDPKIIYSLNKNDYTPYMLWCITKSLAKFKVNFVYKDAITKYLLNFHNEQNCKRILKALNDKRFFKTSDDKIYFNGIHNIKNTLGANIITGYSRLALPSIKAFKMQCTYVIAELPYINPQTKSNNQKTTFDVMNPKTTHGRAFNTIAEKMSLSKSTVSRFLTNHPKKTSTNFVYEYDSLEEAKNFQNELSILGKFGKIKNSSKINNSTVNRYYVVEKSSNIYYKTSFTICRIGTENVDSSSGNFVMSFYNTLKHIKDLNIRQISLNQKLSLSIKELNKFFKGKHDKIASKIKLFYSMKSQHPKLKPNEYIKEIISKRQIDNFKSKYRMTSFDKIAMINLKNAKRIRITSWDRVDLGKKISVKDQLGNWVKKSFYDILSLIRTDNFVPLTI